MGFVFIYPRNIFLEDINILGWDPILLSNVEELHENAVGGMKTG